MSDDIRKKVIEIITEVWDRETQITEAADEIIDIVSAARRNVDAMREALEWYSAQARRMGDAAIRQDSQAILVITLPRDLNMRILRFDGCFAEVIKHARDKSAGYC